MKTRFLLTSAGALIILILATLVVLGWTRPDEEPEVEQIKTDQIEAAAPETKEEETTQEETHEEETIFISSNRIISLDDLDPDWEKAEEDLSAYSVEELANHVLNNGLNGSDREDYLGDRYDEVQDFIDSEYQQPAYVAEDASYDYEPVYYDYSEDVLNPEDGINYYYGVLETYYDLPMDGLVQMLYDMGYEGTYWVREDGVKMWDEYVIVAADFDYEPRGTITETSLGTGIVLDTGEGGWGWHDVATCWGD